MYAGLWFAGLRVSPVFLRTSEIDAGGSAWATSADDGWLVAWEPPVPNEIEDLPYVMPGRPAGAAETLRNRHPRGVLDIKLASPLGDDDPPMSIGWGTGALITVEGGLHFGSRWQFGSYWVTIVMHQGMWLITVAPAGPPVELVRTDTDGMVEILAIDGPGPFEGPPVRPVEDPAGRHFGPPEPGAGTVSLSELISRRRRSGPE